MFCQRVRKLVISDFKIKQFLNIIIIFNIISKVDIEITDQKIEEESKAVGSIDAKVYWNYIRAGAGPILLILSVASTLISQSLFHYSDIWLSEWFVDSLTFNYFIF